MHSADTVHACMLSSFRDCPGMTGAKVDNMPSNSAYIAVHPIVAATTPPVGVVPERANWMTTSSAACPSTRVRGPALTLSVVCLPRHVGSGRTGVRAPNMQWAQTSSGPSCLSVRRLWRSSATLVALCLAERSTRRGTVQARRKHNVALQLIEQR